MNKILPYLKFAKNKYLLVFIVAFVWMMFFDRYDIPSQARMHRRIVQMEADRDFFLSEKERIRETGKVLFSDQAELEKFAREKYHMKRADEDIFVVVE